jgi:hypothetical protein
MNIFLDPFTGVTDGKSSHGNPVYQRATAVDETGGQALRNDKVKLGKDEHNRNSTVLEKSQEFLLGLRPESRITAINAIPGSYQQL